MTKTAFIITAVLAFVSLLPSRGFVPSVLAAGVCHGSCATDVDCATGLVCYQGRCVNPWCPGDEDCVCEAGGGDVNVDVDVDVSNQVNLPGQVLGVQVPSVTPVTGDGADAMVAGLLSIPLLKLGLLLRKYRG